MTVCSENDVAFHVAVNAERAGDRQRSFERHAWSMNPVPLFACAFFAGGGPLPSHIHSPDKVSSTLAVFARMSSN